MLETRHFNSLQSGPHILLMGGMHGDEPCGTVALERLGQELAAGQVPLLKGKVTLIARSNPFALQVNQRFVEENLNRIMAPHATPHNAERRMAVALCEQIESADIVLDLHAVTANSLPFTMLDRDIPAQREWLAALQLPYILTGWDDLYPNEAGVTVVSYAQSRKKMATVVECGCKTDPASALVAYDMARTTLGFFGLTAPWERPPVETRYLRYTQVEYKKREGSFATPWINFSPVAAQQTIGRYHDGGELKAPSDSFIIMPKENAIIGLEEWFYLAVEDSPKAP